MASFMSLSVTFSLNLKSGPSDSILSAMNLMRSMSAIMNGAGSDLCSFRSD